MFSSEAGETTQLSVRLSPGAKKGTFQEVFLLTAHQPIQLLGARPHLCLQMRPPRTAHLECGRPLHLRRLARPLALYPLHLLLLPSRLQHRFILLRGLLLRGLAGAELPTALLERGREARELCVAHLVRARARARVRD